MLFNEDQLAIRDLARRFAREKLLPHYQARDKSGVMDRALIREMGELGLMGVDLPEAYGGLGAPGVTAGIIAEELAYGDFNVSAVPVGVSLLGAIIMSSATPTLADYWIAAHDPRRDADGRLRDRAQRRLGRRRAETALPARRRSLRARRREDLDHLRRLRRRLHRVRAHRRARERRGGRHGAGRAGRYAGHRAHALQRRRQPHHRPRLRLLRRRARAGRKPARRGEPGLHPCHARLRLQPRADRAAMHRLRAGLARRGVGIHEDAHRLQCADRLLSGRHVSAGRGRQPDRRHPPALPITPSRCATPACRTPPRRRW